jgi:membrane protease YdiL (CAAX protease family)
MVLDSTAALIAVTGILAPILEESVFRGFLMTSLTKWVPTPVAVVISACAFAGAHLTPGEFPQLLALGTDSFSKDVSSLLSVLLRCASTCRTEVV